jgi:hypothetical protein
MVEQLLPVRRIAVLSEEPLNDRSHVGAQVDPLDVQLVRYYCDVLLRDSLEAR